MSSPKLNTHNSDSIAKLIVKNDWFMLFRSRTVLISTVSALKSASVFWNSLRHSRAPKNGLTHKAMSYTLNPWETLTGYCEDGRLRISNALAEHAIRPFAVGRRAWLFSDTSRGARASASCPGLVETARANGLEPYAYLEYILHRIAAADALEKLEALLPWNTALVTSDKRD